jgi:uncharacterized protein YjbI with pentapeptide repeats
LSQRTADELALSRLRELPSLPELDFHGSDLRGADLAGLELATASLRGIDLSGADLSGARLNCVDLTDAKLDGANLRGSRFELVNCSAASMEAIDAQEALWSQVDLTAARLTHARLREAAFHGCRFDRAVLDGADLTLGQLAGCRCNGTSFREATLDRTNTADSTFSDADFTGARKFAWSREIIVEILRPEIAEEFEAAQFVGAIAVGHRWCYDDWKRILEAEPDYLERALAVFRRYPESGAGRALEAGLARRSADSA